MYLSKKQTSFLQLVRLFSDIIKNDDDDGDENDNEQKQQLLVVI